jgi:hypothetical protein
MREQETVWLWPYLAVVRLRSAVRQHWKRILVGAAIGWAFAVVGGAVALAALEVRGVVSRDTSDEIGIVIVLYCVGLGALNAYTFRPKASAHDRHRSVTSR